MFVGDITILYPLCSGRVAFGGHDWFSRLCPPKSSFYGSLVDAEQGDGKGAITQKAKKSSQISILTGRTQTGPKWLDKGKGDS